MKFFDKDGRHTTHGIAAEDRLHRMLQKVFKGIDPEDLPHVYAMVIGATVDFVTSAHLNLPRQKPAEPSFDSIRQGMKV